MRLCTGGGGKIPCLYYSLLPPRKSKPATGVTNETANGLPSRFSFFRVRPNVLNGSADPCAFSASWSVYASIMMNCGSPLVLTSRVMLYLRDVDKSCVITDVETRT